MQINEIKKIDVIQHYLIDDKDCIGDYCSVEIRINDEIIIEYGDYYFDRGKERADGFLDALEHLGCKIEPSYDNIPDYEY